MTREEIIRNLKYTMEKHKNDTVYTFGTNISVMCKDILDYLEQEPCDDAQERYKDLCEYFGDAKEILKSREDFKAWLERVKWHIRKAEELYEKYEYKKEPCDKKRDCSTCKYEEYSSNYQPCRDCGTLLESYTKWEQKEQELPCDDAISRSDMLDAIGHGTTYTSEELQRIIQNLPPVNPKPCDNAISREAVLNKIKEVCFSKEWTQFRIDNGSNGQRDFLINYIEQLPPVTQKMGKWIPNYYFYGIYDYTCSECKKHSDERSEFCRKCGAEMENEE